MAHPHVIAAVDARFRAGFVEPDCPIREVNDKPSADKTRTAFVVLQVPWCRSDPATVGAAGRHSSAASIASASIGLWSGARLASARISARTCEVTCVGAVKRAPPCTTRHPTASTLSLLF